MFIETKDFPVGTALSPTYADAIRRGCKQYPRQVFGTSYEDHGGACVVGAMQAGGVESWLLPRDLWCELTRRNDVLRQSREYIADWLDGLVP